MVKAIGWIFTVLLFIALLAFIVVGIASSVNAVTIGEQFTAWFEAIKLWFVKPPVA